MRGFSLIAFAGLLVSGCSTTQPEPVTYTEHVSVHSVLPVYVQMHEAYVTAEETEFDFDTKYQVHFVESLKAELVNHGIFGSVSETGGDDVFEVDVNFMRASTFPGSEHYKLTVALATEYRGERDFNQYHVLFMDEADNDGTAPQDTSIRDGQAATELMSLIIGDIQQAISDQKISLKAHVKERRMDISRMLVKW